MRTNHIDLHRELVEKMGFDIFICDYSYGTHCYQVTKGLNEEWHDYKVDTKNKIVECNAFGIVADKVKEHYEKQGYVVMMDYDVIK